MTSRDRLVTAHRAGGTLSARVAGDGGLTIADYSFSPGTITVHVGDTITRTNNG